MKNLFKALANFQQEVPVIHKDTQSYGYTYTNLTNILTTINPILKKNGLGFTQLLEGDGLKTIIFHCESGESLESKANIPKDVVLKGMNAFQVLGSANTYIRRYALSSALGLITDKDIDACGEQTKKTPSEKLKDCKTLTELANVYSNLTRTEKTAMLTLKDELKLTLK
jgi:hypothetical protein